MCKYHNGAYSQDHMRPYDGSWMVSYSSAFLGGFMVTLWWLSKWEVKIAYNQSLKSWKIHSQIVLTFWRIRNQWARDLGRRAVYAWSSSLLVLLSPAPCRLLHFLTRWVDSTGWIGSLARSLFMIVLIENNWHVICHNKSLVHSLIRSLIRSSA